MSRSRPFVHIPKGEAGANLVAPEYAIWLPRVSGAARPIGLDRATFPRPGATRALSASAPINLMAPLLPGSWPVRSQRGNPSCIAFAAIACLELLRARVTTKIRSLSANDLYVRMREGYEPPEPSPGWEAGATWLWQASERLTKVGAYPLRSFPDDAPLAEKPASTGVPARAREAFYWDGKTDLKDEGVAYRLYSELKQDRPVAIALPQLRAANSKDSSDWKRALTISTGEVPTPTGSLEYDEYAGHAVCVVGFLPAEEPLGGYFLFRNSWSSLWAQYPGHGQVPSNDFRREAGFGLIGADHVEKWCWEMLSLDIVG